MARLKRSPKQPTLRPSANNLLHTIDSRAEPSPGLTVNLSSNNPFRNRAVSPANSLPSPVTATFNTVPSAAPERPISRNPFLDQPQPDKKDTTTVQVRQTSPEKDPYTMAARSSPRKPALTGHAVELFVSCPLPTRLLLKSIHPNFVPPRTTLRLTMGLPPMARHQEACLHRTPTVPRDQKITPQSLPTVYPDTIHRDHRKMLSIDHMRPGDLKRRSTTSLPIHLTQEDRTDVRLDGTRIHQSPAGS